ncbi:aspartate aminotransferase family protein [Nocardia terpenica]|uniref:Aspartate aminotransferase family protein n=2 Tax=Nocardia terpenica TaxID=455432 RepID=A0A291RFB1_9NOCA|nr:aspartate aminotransferase family protein [Nocardia terpenica]
MAPVDAVAAPAGFGNVLRDMTSVVLDALAEGAEQRHGPLPAGGPGAVTRRVHAALGGAVLPEHGDGPETALRELTTVLSAGAADPSDPYCVAHLHVPPLAVAAAADFAASVLNPSMDSWDQAPAASVIEQGVTDVLAALVYPRAARPDAVITSGGTESNLMALLLAREQARGTGPVRVVCGANAHHSNARAAWLLGLPDPVVVDCPHGQLPPESVDRVLRELSRPTVVVATAGTTDEGLIDPLPRLAEIAAAHGAHLHVDAAYGGPLLFSDELAGRLAGIEAADTVSFDLHKLGWQPVASGILAVRDAAVMTRLSIEADYLNAADDTEAGLPDLLGRSLRTSRRPDAFKIAVTMRALGRRGIALLIEHCVRTAERFAAAVDAHPGLRRRPGEIGISTVLLRPIEADWADDHTGDKLVAAVRRHLLHEGTAVLGRAIAADADGQRRLWLKVTLLHPRTDAEQFDGLLDLISRTASLLA